MLVGRLLKGLGLAGPRIVTIAIVQDQYQGPQMARVMSLIMTVFVTVPVFAPLIGQWILELSSWRMIFVVLLILAILVLFWFSLRLQETLSVEARRKFSWKELYVGVKDIAVDKAAVSYVVSLGMAFGTFIGFLSSIPLIFQDLYGVVETFPYYFAVLACGIGTASFLNTKLVMRFGMKSIVKGSQIFSAVLSLVSFVGCLWFEAVPPFWFIMAYLFLLMFPTGLLFGNLSTLALAGYSHIAGIASSFVGVTSTLLSVFFGALIGQAYNQTVIPLVVGVLLLSICAFVVTSWADYKSAE